MLRELEVMRQSSSKKIAQADQIVKKCQGEQKEAVGWPLGGQGSLLFVRVVSLFRPVTFSHQNENNELNKSWRKQGCYLRKNRPIASANSYARMWWSFSAPC